MIFSEAEKFGFELARAGLDVLYVERADGTTSGAMGALVEGVLNGGGSLLATSRSQMISRSEAFVAMPGGIGTLDEVTDVLALNHGESVSKPLVFYNFLGVWTPFIESLDLLYQGGFVSAPPTDLFEVFESSTDVIDFFKNAL